MTDENFQHLVVLYLEDAIDAHELKSLRAELDRSPERVRQFNDLRLMTGLIYEHGQDSGEPQSRLTLPKNVKPRTRFKPTWSLAVSGSLAASILLGILLPRLLEPSPVAKLIASENAAWESSLPTAAGSELIPGILELKSGIGTIRFRSGARVTLQAPARLELINPMRGRLLVGMVGIEVPESATGFVMETPNGHAVDHGTAFSVSFDPLEMQSRFKVIEGEISVHVASTGQHARLKGEGTNAIVTSNSLTTGEAFQPELGPQPGPEVLIIGTGGREGTAIRNDAREFISPRYLTVNRLFNKEWDRRSFFAFDLSSVDMDRVGRVTLRLNLVPFPYGIFGVLPKSNRYAVYGLTNPEKVHWDKECLWEDSPAPEDGVLIGTFDIPRSQQQGSFAISNKELRQFLIEQGEREVTFIVVRENLPLKNGDVPCHAFAGQRHPEANGPQLEFVVAESD
jgi:hypothetical protein